MSNHDLVSIKRIFKHLDHCEPLEPNTEKPLRAFTLNGKPVYLHTDVNRNVDYGLIWEWWLSSDGDDWLTGGFEPAVNDEEVMQLAGIIHAACEKVLGSAGVREN